MPEVDADAAHERLEERLGQLRSRLERARLRGVFALFVVESAHWARFEANGGTVRIASHAALGDNEPVLLTSEAALGALLDGRLAVDAATQAGLLRWAGNPPTPALAETLQVALAAAA